MYPAIGWPLTFLLFGFGATIGSFLNVCIFRIPEKTFFAASRSQCRSCGTPIPWYFNIPLFGFLVLRGRARCCGVRIHWQYPLMECLTGLAFVFIYLTAPFFLDWPNLQQIDPRELIRFIHLVTFTCLMFVCSAIDLRHMIIPDVISLPMIALTPLIVFVHPELDWKSALFGVIGGGGILYVVAWLYWLVRKEVGMGMGDVKLLAAIGGWLGYQAIIPTIFYGSISGALVGISVMFATRRMTMKTAIPFGPFLAFGALLNLFVGENLQEFLLKLQN